MNPMNFHRLRGNWKALSAALGVGVLITMGAVTLVYPISVVGTSSDSCKADTRITDAVSCAALRRPEGQCVAMR
jgi:hypothetical protein